MTAEEAIAATKRGEPIHVSADEIVRFLALIGSRDWGQQPYTKTVTTSSMSTPAALAAGRTASTTANSLIDCGTLRTLG